MLLTLGLMLVGVWALRAGAHALILRGLRAPRVAHQYSPVKPGQAAVELRIPTANGKTLFAWFVSSGGRSPEPAIVVMHGWGANASLMLDALAPLRAAGWAVLLLDARCHGRSDDEDFTSLPRFAEDIEAGLDWLKKQQQVDPSRLAAMGHSVGAAAVLLSARRRHQVCAVISISAFAHPREVMRRLLASHRIPYPVLGWYVLRHVQHVIGASFDDIAPLRSIALLQCPVLLVHGTDDELVPIEDARRLLAAGRTGAVSLIEIAGKHDPGDALQAHLPEMMAFLQRSAALVDTPTLSSPAPTYPSPDARPSNQRQF